MLRAWGGFVHDRRRWVLALAAALLAVALASLGWRGALTTGTIRGIEADDAHALAVAALGDRAGPSFIAVFRSDRWTTEDPELYEAMGKALEPVAATPEVARVLSPVEAPPRLGEKLVLADKHGAVAVVVLRERDVSAALAQYPAVRAKIAPGPLRVACTGDLAYRHDLEATLEHDLALAELVSMPLAVVVLLFVFRSVVASLLPVVVGGLSVLSGIAVVFQLARIADMPVYTVNVASLIGLGVAIDYSLFVVSRFREELARGSPVREAVAESMRTSGRAVLYSGLAVGTGLAGLLFFPRSYLAAMGAGGAVVVVFAVGFALTALPALLSALGPRIDAGRLPIARAGGEEGAFWRRLAPWVMARPVRVLLPTLAFVVALGVPFARLRMAAAWVAVLPLETEARAAFETLRRELPAQAGTRADVVVTFPDERLTKERVRALLELRDRLRALPGVDDVESVLDFDPDLPREQAAELLSLPPELRPIDVATALEHTTGRGSTVLTVVSRADPESEPARALVRAIRGARAVGDGALRVGGQTALDVDSVDFIVGRAPRAAAFVVALTYVVLLLLLGSVVLPLKAVVMNVLSIAGSFGALVFVFQDGRFARWLRFEPGPIEPTLPVLLFCVVFGLSMDYEVLLLGRMHEEYRRHRDNRRAVTEGLARSGRLITSAAAIMVSVFAAFALARVIMLKAMGVGLCVAVTLDATLVRLLIVPATMRLFGDLNWWAPAPLARLLERTARPH